MTLYGWGALAAAICIVPRSPEHDPAMLIALPMNGYNVFHIPSRPLFPGMDDESTWSLTFC
jgi:hypothetical protein